MLWRKLLLIVGIGFSLNLTQAQIGGEAVYTFLDLPSSARIMALGSSGIALPSDDISLSSNNPALINPNIANQMHATTAAFFGGVNYGQLSYAPATNGFGSWQANLQYITYGKLTRTDALFNELGEFAASEFAASAGYSLPYKHYRFGANAKLIYSQFDQYNSIGSAVDLAAAYTDTSRDMSFSLLIKNVGTQFTTYQKGNREKLPFDVQFGLSKRLKHVPLRFMFTVHNLHRWNIRFDDPNVQEEVNPFDTTAVKEKKYIVDKLFRHLIVGTEIYFGKNFRVSLAYNHQRRAEMVMDTRLGLAGFSFGAGVRIRQFRFDYGMAKYHPSGLANQFSLTTRFADFKKKEKHVSN